MRNVRFLAAAIVAAVVLAISRPAGVGSDRAGTEEAVPREPPAASAPGAGRSASAETPKPEAGSGDSSRCSREVLAGTAEWMPATDIIADALAASQDAEHLLAAALLTLDADPAQGSELLARAWNANPGHPLIAINRLDACTENPDLQACAAHDVEADAIRIDGSNGALWARIAARRYGHGDHAGALQALQRAATAPRYDVYWIDHVRLFDRALAASTGQSYAERTIAAIGITAAMRRPDLEVVTACTEQVGPSPEWRPGCGDFGRRLEADGETLFDMAVGASIQAAVYEAIGDRQKLAIASRKRNAFSAAVTEDLWDAQMLLFEDEGLLSDYLNEFEAYGELAAIQFLENEFARLQALPGYDPCD